MNMTISLRAGIAGCDISPRPGVPLGGYPHFTRPNTGVHDPLRASCLVLDDGTTRLALVGMDMLTCSRRDALEVRRRAASRTGIPAEHIAIFCSHSHSSPEGCFFMELDAPHDMAAPDPEYIAWLRNTLTDLIAEAAAAPFDARLAVDKGRCGRECGVGGNRRDPDGAADPEVWTVGVQDAGGRWRAALVKYALHPTVLHEDNTRVSADYPGAVRRCVEGEFPGLVMLFAQGVAGDQSTRYFRQGQSFEEADRIGSAIGREAVAVLHRQRNPAAARLGVWSEPLSFDLKELPPRAGVEARLEQARRRYEALKTAGAPYLDVQNANLAVLGEEDTLACLRICERGERMPFVEDELPGEVQVVGLGDARLVFLPGEVFVELGLRIQRESPFPKTFVVTCANGFLPGYLCTAEAVAAGGYEVGTSLLAPESGDQLVRATVALLRRSQTLSLKA